MRRRLIPPIIALIVGIAAVSPLLTEWPSEKETNTWTLFALTGMFAFKTIMFLWMRIRMVNKIRNLTVFGAALADFFAAIAVCDIAIAAVFAIAYLYARHLHMAPYWLRISDRAALIAGVVFVITTGGAVAYEMRRAGLVLHVHEEGI